MSATFFRVDCDFKLYENELEERPNGYTLCRCEEKHILIKREDVWNSYDIDWDELDD